VKDHWRPALCRSDVNGRDLAQRRCSASAQQCHLLRAERMQTDRRERCAPDHCRKPVAARIIKVTATSMRRTQHYSTGFLIERSASPDERDRPCVPVHAAAACCCCMLLLLSSAFASPYMVEPPPPLGGSMCGGDAPQRTIQPKNRCTLLVPASDTRAHGKPRGCPFPRRLVRTPDSEQGRNVRNRLRSDTVHITVQVRAPCVCRAPPSPGSGAAPAVRSSSSCGCDGRIGVRRRRGTACTYCTTVRPQGWTRAIPSVARCASLWIFGASEELGLARLVALTQSCLLDRTNDCSGFVEAMPNLGRRAQRKVAWVGLTFFPSSNTMAHDPRPNLRCTNKEEPSRMRHAHPRRTRGSVDYLACRTVEYRLRQNVSTKMDPYVVVVVRPLGRPDERIAAFRDTTLARTAIPSPFDLKRTVWAAALPHRGKSGGRHGTGPGVRF
jgi:hypothetical protein